LMVPCSIKRINPASFWEGTGEASIESFFSFRTASSSVSVQLLASFALTPSFTQPSK